MTTETFDGTVITYCNPPKAVWENWKEEADEMGMTVPEYIQSMVAAGRKGFNRDVSPDETNQELRKQRNHYKKQLEQANQRAGELEEQLATGERQAIIQYVDSNPGSTYTEIVTHVASTVNGRVTDLLELMEGREIIVEDGEYYPVGRER